MLLKKLKDKKGGSDKIMTIIMLLALSLLLIIKTAIPQTNTTVELGSKVNIELEKLEEVFD